MISSPDFFKSILKNIDKGVITTNLAIEIIIRLPTKIIIGKNILNNFTGIVTIELENIYLQSVKTIKLSISNQVSEIEENITC